MTKPILSQEYVCALFEYRDGELYWKHRPREEFRTYHTFRVWNGRYSNKKAGCIMNTSGYKTLSINNRHHYLHRIIFLMHYGYMPKQIDHIDCNRSNNKIENLRAATDTQNKSNRKRVRTNTSGYKNVAWAKKQNMWHVSIGYKKKNIHIGSFKNIEDAVQAAREARQKYHGEFARHE